MSDVCFEVTFKLAKTVVNVTGPEASGCVSVLEKAFFPCKGPGWSDTLGRLRTWLCRGDAVRLRLTSLQFARFFMERRKAGPGPQQRLKWDDAKEVPREEDTVILMDLVRFGDEG